MYDMPADQRVNITMLAMIKGESDPKRGRIEDAFRVGERGLLFNEETSGADIEKTEGCSPRSGRGCDNCIASSYVRDNEESYTHHLYVS